jgi:hypothetical protein
VQKSPVSIMAGSFAIRQSKTILARSCEASPFFEIALVLVRFDHGANRIVNADHSIM